MKKFFDLTYGEGAFGKNLLAVLTTGFIVLLHLFEVLIVSELKLPLTLINQLFHLSFRAIEHRGQVVPHHQFRE